MTRYWSQPLTAWPLFRRKCGLDKYGNPDTRDRPWRTVFLLAFCAYASAKTDGEILYARCIDGRHSEPSANAPTQISICQQHVIGKFHVDFLITGYEFL